MQAKSEFAVSLGTVECPRRIGDPVRSHRLAKHLPRSRRLLLQSATPLEIGYEHNFAEENSSLCHRDISATLTTVKEKRAATGTHISKYTQTNKQASKPREYAPSKHGARRCARHGKRTKTSHGEANIGDIYTCPRCWPHHLEKRAKARTTCRSALSAFALVSWRNGQSTIKRNQIIDATLQFATATYSKTKAWHESRK